MLIKMWIPDCASCRFF